MVVEEDGYYCGMCSSPGEGKMMYLLEKFQATEMDLSSYEAPYKSVYHCLDCGAYFCENCALFCEDCGEPVCPKCDYKKKIPAVEKIFCDDCAKAYKSSNAE